MNVTHHKQPRKHFDADTHPPCAFHCVVEDGALGLYVVFDGKRIARRGDPDTPQARTWISLEPGFVVRDRGKRGIIVEYNGVVLQ